MDVRALPAAEVQLLLRGGTVKTPWFLASCPAPRHALRATKPPVLTLHCACGGMVGAVVRRRDGDLLLALVLWPKGNAVQAEWLDEATRFPAARCVECGRTQQGHREGLDVLRAELAAGRRGRRLVAPVSRFHADAARVAAHARPPL